MIDWLFSGWLSEIIVPFSLVCCLLLACRRYLLNFYGPQLSYATWLLLPASLIVPVIKLPNWFAAVNQGQNIQRFLTVNGASPQAFGLEGILFYGWVVGFSALVALWLFRHLSLLYAQRQWQETDLVLMTESGVEITTLKSYRSAAVFSPMLVGIFKQKLVIPEDFEAIFTKEQQRLILEHELCHFKRNDLLWNSIALVILALMWFHPLAWLAFSRFRRDQELSCDQTVLARKHKACRINYSKALLVAAETAPPLGFAQLSFKEYGDKDVMFERINLIKRGHRCSKPVGGIMLAIAVSLLSAMSYAGVDDTTKAKRTPPKPKEVISPIYRVEPTYPEKAVVEKLEGSVVLKYDVDLDGSVMNVEVMSGQPAHVFDRSAIAALKQWKYEKLKTVAKNNLVQLDFLLGEESSYKSADLIEKIKVTQ